MEGLYMRRRRKSVYRNWWVWLIVIVAVVIIYLVASGERIPEEEIQRDGSDDDEVTIEQFENQMAISEFVEAEDLENRFSMTLFQI